jgi:hypothetical protein
MTGIAARTGSKVTTTSRPDGTTTKTQMRTLRNMVRGTRVCSIACVPKIIVEDQSR